MDNKKLITTINSLKNLMDLDDETIEKLIVKYAYNITKDCDSESFKMLKSELLNILI